MRHLFAAVMALALGCGGGGTATSQVPTGEYGGPCYGNGTCNTALECRSNLCVNLGTAGAVGTAGAGGVGGGTTTPPPASFSGNWTVEIDTNIWICSGTLVLTFTAASTGFVVSGSWTCAETQAECYWRKAYVSETPACVAYSGDVTGTVSATDAMDLSLYTAPTQAIQMSGTDGNGVIAGTATFSDGSYPFKAIPQ